MNRHFSVLLLMLMALLIPPQSSSATTPTPPPANGSKPRIFVGAGDISICGSTTDDDTAALLDGIPGLVYTAGDNAYYSGTVAEYACYDASWGRHKARTKPVIGNHDFVTGQGSVYHSYFGPGFGVPNASYYSFHYGSWLIIALDSNIPMTLPSPQAVWLDNLLSTDPTVCTIALWHHPLFSSGPHGNNSFAYYIWQILYNHHVEIVINGHDHDYERFAPQTPDGAPDPAYGIREFVVGTGGAPLYTWGTLAANSEVRNNTTYGVLKFTLRDRDYSWDFIHTPGSTFTDTGSGICRS